MEKTTDFRLDKIVEEKHLLKHPFYQRWLAGSLTLDELKRYVANYYPHVLAFPAYVSAVHSLCDDLETRQDLLENLIEEERGEENHPELWLRFSDSLGVARDEVKKQNVIPEAKTLVDTFRNLTRRSFAAGLGALYAYESQVPAVAEKKIEGLKKFYGIDSKSGLQFFDVHQKADVYHSRTTREKIQAMSENDQKEAEEAAKVASRALWDFLSGLDREAGIEGTC